MPRLARHVAPLPQDPAVLGETSICSGDTVALWPTLRRSLVQRQRLGGHLIAFVIVDAAAQLALLRDR